MNVYRLNENFALLPEIENMVRKTFGIETKLGEELGK